MAAGPTVSRRSEIRKEVVGFTRGHCGQSSREVVSITLMLDDTALTVWSYGATLVELCIPDKGGLVSNVVQRLPDLGAYETDDAYVGATMGRYARCVAGGRLKLGGREYQLDRNLGGHHFHGGSLGFHRYVWDAEAGRDGEALVARFRHLSPDGDQGYPGAVEVVATFRLHPGRRLSIEYEGRTSATTLIGLTSHAFWSLVGAGRIDAHELRVASSCVVATDDAHIPFDSSRRIVGTSLDFTTGRRIGSLELDHCFVVGCAKPVLELRHPLTCRRLTISTDQPGLALYTGDRLAAPRGGLCIQPTALPDAPNRPDFPSALLEPGETYHSRSIYEFSCDAADGPVVPTLPAFAR